MKRLVICALLVGCGGDDGDDFIALDDLGIETATASCGKEFDCCTDAEIMQRYMSIEHDGEPITTEAQCIEFANAFFTTFAVTEFKESLEKGRIEYDGAAAAQCMAAIRGLTCAQLAADELDGVSCRPYLVPKVVDGGACKQDFECISDNCVGARRPLGEPHTDGACEPMPNAGEPCDDNCVDGYFCGYDQTANMDICLTVKPDGAECRFDDECESDDCDTSASMCVSAALTCDGR